MDEPSRPPTLAQDVTNKLRERILKRELVAGEPLRQNAIASTFGTSIIPVREAFRQLEAEGLLESRSHHGVVVAEFSPENAREWIHLRRLIETDLLGFAIDKMTDEDIERASEIQDRFNVALEQRKVFEQWSDINWQFHAALLAPADRPETMKILSVLHKKCERYAQLNLLDDDQIDRDQKEHNEILDLCRRRRKREAKMAWSRHIAGVERNLIDEIDS